MKKTSFLSFLLLGGLGLLFSAFTAKTVFFDQQKVTFEDFLQQFPQQNLPYALDEQQLRARLGEYVEQVNNPKKSYYNEKAPHLDHPYTKFLPQLESESMFSRMPIMIEPVAQFATAKNYAVLYASARSFRRGYATYYMVVYDKKGNAISSNQVGMIGAETIGSVLITRDLKAEMKSWQIEWKKSYADNGLDGNRIKGLSYLDSHKINLLTPTDFSKKRNEHSPLSPEAPAPQQVQESGKTK